MYGILPGVKVTTSEPDLHDALSEGYKRKILSSHLVSHERIYHLLYHKHAAVERAAG